MIVYLDTSAFLKLYLEEEGSETVRDSMAVATAVCTHIITYTEMCAAMAQAVRIGRITEAERLHQKQYFEQDWQALDVLAVDEPMARRAGQLAEAFGLRGFDSMQLAGAEKVWRHVPDNFQIAVYDKRLAQAASILGMAGIGVAGKI